MSFMEPKRCPYLKSLTRIQNLRKRLQINLDRGQKSQKLKSLRKGEKVIDHLQALQKMRSQKWKSQKVLDVQDLNRNWRMLTIQIPILISRKSLSRLQQPKRLQKLDLRQK